MFDDVVADRRSTPRLATELPVVFSDYQYEWDATCLSLSASGCFIATDTLFAPGKDVEVTLNHPDGDTLKAEGRVRWARGTGEREAPGLGIAFDLRSSDIAAGLTDFVERLAVVDVETATRFRAAGKPLPASTILYVARDAPPNPTLTTEERAFLACVDGQAALYEIKSSVGDTQWERICFAPFSLLGKGVLTRRKANADPRRLSGASQRVGGGGSGNAPTAGQVIRRSEKAQDYYQQALYALRANDKRLALTNLRLAIMLAPGDPEITATLAELEE